MAYMSQERKKEKAPKIKAILAKYGLKGSLSVDGRSTLVLTIKSGKLDFITPYNKYGREEWEYKNPTWKWHDEKYMSVSGHRMDSLYCGRNFTTVPECQELANCLKELQEVMDEDNHDNSDSQTDYFDIGWYTSIKIGSWDKPYEVTE